MDRKLRIVLVLLVLGLLWGTPSSSAQATGRILAPILNGSGSATSGGGGGGGGGVALVQAGHFSHGVNANVTLSTTATNKLYIGVLYANQADGHAPTITGQTLSPSCGDTTSDATWRMKWWVSDSLAGGTQTVNFDSGGNYSSMVAFEVSGSTAVDDCHVKYDNGLSQTWTAVTIAPSSTDLVLATLADYAADSLSSVTWTSSGMSSVAGATDLTNGIASATASGITTTYTPAASWTLSQVPYLSSLSIK